MDRSIPGLRRRRALRLKGYDYAQAGAYFVTVCTQGRACLFADMVHGEMRLNACGDIVKACWNDLPHHYGHIELDAFVVMPNHVHAIIVLSGVTLGIPVAGTGLKAATARPPLSEIVRGFKTFSARRINEERAAPALPVWQRNYYEHVIRNEDDLDQVREYIATNPVRWLEDEENPARAGHGG